MSIEHFKNRIPEFAKDVRLNLGTIQTDETLPPQSKYRLLFATAIASCR